MIQAFVFTICTLLSVSNAMDHNEVLYDVVFNISCNNPHVSDRKILNNPSNYKVVWILPSGELIQNDNTDHPRVQAGARGTKLMIRKVDDPDFGYYHCMININTKNEYFVSKIGVNVDGPYWGDLLAKYKTQIIVGCIASGVVFFGSIFACIAFDQLCGKKRRRHSYDKDAIETPSYNNTTYESDFHEMKQSKSDLNSVEVDLDITASSGADSKNDVVHRL